MYSHFQKTLALLFCFQPSDKAVACVNRSGLFTLLIIMRALGSSITIYIQIQ